eukprot:TRINITY_DN22316_c0_g1_i1.p2 TRINITY_DN22316_c0_g1~~TRINITY_DN22316_c0_g1_i1.p2  ORF type:complete len:102 (-),score=2.62 TRINITY_DN22316_c0_g1_i1:151-456(-)
MIIYADEMLIVYVIVAVSTYAQKDKSTDKGALNQPLARKYLPGNTPQHLKTPGANINLYTQDYLYKSKILSLLGTSPAAFKTLSHSSFYDAIPTAVCNLLN